MQRKEFDEIEHLFMINTQEIEERHKLPHSKVSICQKYVFHTSGSKIKAIRILNLEFEEF
jgi:hypothetical protein